MNKLLCNSTSVVSSFIALMFATADRAWGVEPDPNDAWDVKQGSIVISHSPLSNLVYTDIRNMFGGAFGTTGAENVQTYFSDGMPNEYVHFVEWKTRYPLELSEIHLFAAGDGPIYLNQREFSRFNLEAKIQGESTYSLVASFTPSHPFSFLNSTNGFIFATNFTGLIAREFRAEFFAFNAGRGYDGPRIIELDGFGKFLQPPLEFTPQSSEFTNSITVGITAIQTNGVVRYTLDGSKPSSSSPIYEKPLSLTSTTTVRAAAFDGDTPLSDEVEAIFSRVYALNDGIPSTWRKEYFGDSFRTDPRVAPLRDPDDDGANNYQEYLANTDPLDPKSVKSPLPLLLMLPASMDFTNWVDISMSTFLPNAVIRYSLDNTEPTPNSERFTSWITLDRSAAIKAQVFINGIPVSPVVGGTFRRYYAMDDGISRSWREQYFGADYEYDPRIGADLDPDSDGANNLEEFLAATNPLDSGSVLKINSLTMVPVIVWSSISNQTYQVMRKDDLTTTNWTLVGHNVVATNELATFIDFSSTNKKAFYWITPQP